MKPSWYEPTPRDWTEDFPGENGCYLHVCKMCRQQFTGDKRRFPMCKLCSNESGLDHCDEAESTLL